MRLQEVIDALKDCEDGPIDPQTVANIITIRSPIDTFEFVGVSIDAKILRGCLVRSNIMDSVPRPYGASEVVAQIFYANGQDKSEERISLIKEILHICDPDVLRANNKEKVEKLMQDINIPQDALIATACGLDRLRALVDNMADYRALLIMCPSSLRKLAIQRLQEGKKSQQEIAEMFGFPLRYISIFTNNAVWDGFAKLWRQLDELHPQKCLA